MHEVTAQKLVVWPLNFSQCLSHVPHLHVESDVPLMFVTFTTIPFWGAAPFRSESNENARTGYPCVRFAASGRARKAES
jgi:hypothetical protein